MDRRANELVAALARTKKTIENRPRALALSPVVVVDKSRTNETLKWSLARWTMIQQQQVIYVNGVHEIFLGFIGEEGGVGGGGGTNSKITGAEINGRLSG